MKMIDMNNRFDNIKSHQNIKFEIVCAVQRPRKC